MYPGLGNEKAPGKLWRILDGQTIRRCQLAFAGASPAPWEHSLWVARGYLHFMTSAGPSLSLPKPKLPLVKLLGAKLHLLSWLNYLLGEIPPALQLLHQKQFLCHFVWKYPAWCFLWKGRSHTDSNAMALFKDKSFI